MAGLLTRTALVAVVFGLLVYAILPYIYPSSGLVPAADPRAPRNSLHVPRADSNSLHVPMAHDDVPGVNATFGESFEKFFELGGEEETEESVPDENSSGTGRNDLGDTAGDLGEELDMGEELDLDRPGLDYASLVSPHVCQILQAARLRVLPKARAQKTGALCLDGLAPGYYYRPGSGSGSRSWIVYLRGGEGCASEEDCYQRSQTLLGSLQRSGKWRKLGGILSGDKQLNPDFHNWNAISLVYCDGFSFAGDRSSPIFYNGTKLFSRGRRVLDEIFRELLRSGMAAAVRVILFGHSAGGLGVLLNAHRLRNLLPAGVDFKLFVSSVLQPKVPFKGSYTKGIKDILQTMADLHNSSGTIPRACVRRHPSKEYACLLPSNLVPVQPADAFYVNAVYDRWSLENLLHVRCEPNSCRDSDKTKLQAWSAAMLDQVPRMLRPGDGIFLANCVTHTIAVDDGTWACTRVGGKSIAHAFGDWYFGRGESHRHIDCVGLDCYPNPTCG
ncbi:uncharacterized protein LOC144926572 isoform X1 [Branchiostoma floridae x Branchiostoma belcheri]